MNLVDLPGLNFMLLVHIQPIRDMKHLFRHPWLYLDLVKEENKSRICYLNPEFQMFSPGWVYVDAK